MPFEVIQHLQGPPNRVYDLVMVLKKVGKMSRESLRRWLQPAAIKGTSAAFNHPIRIALHIDLIRENDAGILHLTDSDSLTSYEQFRGMMQQRLLGATQAHEDNYILNQFTAWYVVQNDAVLDMELIEFERQFHQDLHPEVAYEDDNIRLISAQDSLRAWGLWTRFLGHGREFSPRRGSRRLIPNAAIRLAPILQAILPVDGSSLPIDECIAQIGQHCPELDGGRLYRQCYEAVHKQSVENRSLSLMISSGLHTLAYQQQIELLNEPDAPHTRQLFPSQTFINRVSHIKRYLPEEAA